MVINGKDYIINRNTARVTKYDKIYCELLKEIKECGELCPNRTGIETLAIPNAHIDLDVGEEFPILETKKVAIKNTITELLWIYQAQSNDIKWLLERDNHIWDEWMIDSDGIYRIYDPYKNYNDGNKVEVKNVDGISLDKTKIGKKIYAESLSDNKSLRNAIYYGKKYAGTIGQAYGYIINKTKEFDRVLKDLKTIPRSRRMVISLRQAANLKNGVLEPCVWSNEYTLHKGRLYSLVDIRSNDMPLGNPFNVTQYSILLSILAKISNLEVGGISFNISNCHLYVNQLDGINLQLSRYEKLLKWEKFIQNHTDKEIESEHKELLNRKNYLDKKIKDNPFLEKDYKTINNEVNEEIMCLEHLITRENPELFIRDNKEFYELDNKKDNEDIKVLKYSSLPGIKMPVAQ